MPASLDPKHMSLFEGCNLGVENQSSLASRARAPKTLKLTQRRSASQGTLSLSTLTCSRRPKPEHDTYVHAVRTAS